MITPTSITNYNRTDAELQAFWLFGAFCAGKNSEYASRCLSHMLSKCTDELPFEYLRKLGAIGIQNVLVASRIGQYARLTRFIMESLDLDLRNSSVDDLMNVFGIGPKTARFFILHTRPNQKLAVLDTHILKYLADKGVDAPPATPTYKKKYQELENQFIHLASSDFPHMSIADIDLMLWMKYSGRLESDQLEPSIPIAL